MVRSENFFWWFVVSVSLFSNFYLLSPFSVSVRIIELSAWGARDALWGPLFSNSSWLPQHAGQLRRVSPDEEHHAFILATARDLAAGKSEQEWKAKWLSCIATFVRLDSQEAAFWRARKGKGSHRSTVRFDVLFNWILIISPWES